MPRRNRKVLSKAVRKEVRKIAYATQETKHHRVEDNVDFANVGTLVELNTVDSQGVASGQFVGQEIRQMSLRLRGMLTQADSSNLARVIIFTPTAEGQVLLTAGSTVNSLFYATAGSDSLYSFVREALVARVYFDRNYILNIASGQNDHTRFIRLSINLHMKKYIVNEGTSSGSNKIYLGLISDSGLATHPSLNFESFLAYKDA